MIVKLVIQVLIIGTTGAAVSATSIFLGKLDAPDTSLKGIIESSHRIVVISIADECVTFAFTTLTAIYFWWLVGLD